MNYYEYQKQMSYYQTLEDDVFYTDLYVSIDKENFKTFSMQYGKILLMICSEIDMLLKRLCKELDGSFSGSTITEYYEIINRQFKFFITEGIQFEYPNISLTPWIDWKKDCSPKWWSDYNKLKHKRLESDDAGEPYFKRANQCNTLNALAALYIVEQYLLYLGEKEIIRRQVANHYSLFLLFKSNRLIMKHWQHCYSSFWGSSVFDFQMLESLMENR